jgi:hypothetical protein
MTPGWWESMDQDHEAEATRREELDRTWDVGKSDEGRERTPKLVAKRTASTRKLMRRS